MSEAVLDAQVELTDRAARRVAEILKAEPAGAVMRVGVDGGGCSGFQYTYDVAAEAAPDDLILERAGATVVIDPISLDLLKGSRIDFVDDLMGRAFRIENPQATGGCGCGASFSI